MFSQHNKRLAKLLLDLSSLFLLHGLSLGARIRFLSGHRERQSSLLRAAALGELRDKS